MYAPSRTSLSPPVNERTQLVFSKYRNKTIAARNVYSQKSTSYGTLPVMASKNTRLLRSFFFPIFFIFPRKSDLVNTGSSRTTGTKAWISRKKPALRLTWKPDLGGMHAAGGDIRIVDGMMHRKTNGSERFVFLRRRPALPVVVYNPQLPTRRL